MKMWLASLFLFIFSSQVLPVKEVGKILFKSQLTEEIHEHHSPDDHQKSKKFSDPFTGLSGDITVRLLQVSHDAALAIHYADYAPAAHVPDIFTPPPNC